MRFALPLLCVLALAAAGCGGDDDEGPVDRSVPAVTVPGSDLSYEQGGADGSGADGSDRPHPRGGIAAGPDDSGPGIRE